jgi:hypothetical protein
MGCSVPISVSFHKPLPFNHLSISVPQIYLDDESNQRTRLCHRGRHGFDCPFNQTFRQLVYAVFHSPPVRQLFRQSSYNADHLNLDLPNTMDLARWFVRVPATNAPINNMLTVVEFVVSLRGLPIENPDIPAIWFTEHE